MWTHFVALTTLSSGVEFVVLHRKQTKERTKTATFNADVQSVLIMLSTEAITLSVCALLIHKLLFFCIWSHAYMHQHICHCNISKHLLMYKPFIMFKNLCVSSSNQKCGLFFCISKTVGELVCARCTEPTVTRRDAYFECAVFSPNAPKPE